MIKESLVSGEIWQNTGCDPGGRKSVITAPLNMLCPLGGQSRINVGYDPERARLPEGRVTAYSPKGVNGDRAFPTPKGPQPVFKSAYEKASPMVDDPFSLRCGTGRAGYLRNIPRTLLGP